MITEKVTVTKNFPVRPVCLINESLYRSIKNCLTQAGRPIALSTQDLAYICSPTAGPSLRVASTMSVGYGMQPFLRSKVIIMHHSTNLITEHVDLPEVIKRGVKVGYTPDVLTGAGTSISRCFLIFTLTVHHSRRPFRHARSHGWTKWRRSYHICSTEQSNVLPLLTSIHILIRSDPIVAVLQLGPLCILRPTAQLFPDQSKTDSRLPRLRAHLTSHIGAARALRDHLLHLQL
jgi:hypothetical protein